MENNPQTNFQNEPVTPVQEPAEQPYSQPYAQLAEQPYSQPYAQPANQPVPAPVGQIKTNRGLIKLLLLSLITFGIYAIVAYSSISNDINVIAGRYDGKKTMHYCLLMFIVAPITLGIGAIVWMHKISARIGNELTRRNIDYKFGAGSFWLWNTLGAFIIVGPFIYVHKLLKAMNLLSEHYNING